MQFRAIRNRNFERPTWQLFRVGEAEPFGHLTRTEHTWLFRGEDKDTTWIIAEAISEKLRITAKTPIRNVLGAIREAYEEIDRKAA